MVGSSNSSNSNRLREIGAEMNVPSYLIDDGRRYRSQWFAGTKTVGLTAGASAPEELVQQVIARLAAFGPLELQNLKVLKKTCSSSCRTCCGMSRIEIRQGPQAAGAFAAHVARRELICFS